MVEPLGREADTRVADAARRCRPRRGRAASTVKPRRPRRRRAAACRPCSRAWNTTVPNTRRIGWAKLSAVYCVAGLGSGKPQSQAGPRRTAREAKRWMTLDRQQRRDRDEDEDEQAVVGAAALGDRHDRQPGERASARGMRAADQPLHHRRQRIDDEAGQDAGQQAEAAASASMAREREAVGLAAPARPPAMRGRPRKVMPKARTKQAAASAADSASIAPTAGTSSFRPHCGRSGLSRMAWKISHSETKPLSGGSAEIATHADQEGEAPSAACGGSGRRAAPCRARRSRSARRRRRRTAGS